MRVIAGSAKGRKLFEPLKGSGIRPITDRAKESLFNILGWRVEKSSFLDLFAGTGSVGIEALSRGASQATFVEKFPKCLRTIDRNLKHLELTANARIVLNDAFKFLTTAPTVFDYIFIAPPQYHELWSKALLLIDRAPGWIENEGTVIVQIDPTEFRHLELDSLELRDRRCYSNVMLSFYQLIKI